MPSSSSVTTTQAACSNQVEAVGRVTFPNESVDSGQVKVSVRNREKGRDDVVEHPFDYLIVALPFDALDRVLPETAQSAPLREKAAHFENSPITGIHLWFDRHISELDHAVLLDRTIQWMFHKSRLQPFVPKAVTASSGSYIELVVSSSKSLIDKSRSRNRRSRSTKSASSFPMHAPPTWSNRL